jgi:hypothetical protein
MDRCHTCEETAWGMAKRAASCRPRAVKAHGAHWDWVARYKAEKAAEEASAQEALFERYAGKEPAEVLQIALENEEGYWTDVALRALDAAGFQIVRTPGTAKDPQSDDFVPAGMDAYYAALEGTQV